MHTSQNHMIGYVEESQFSMHLHVTTLVLKRRTNSFHSLPMELKGNSRRHHKCHKRFAMYDNGHLPRSA